MPEIVMSVFDTRGDVYSVGTRAATNVDVPHAALRCRHLAAHYKQGGQICSDLGTTIRSL